MLHAMHVHANKQMNIMPCIYHAHALTLPSAALLLSAFYNRRGVCDSASARGEKKDRPDLQARSGATGSAGRAALSPARRAVSVHRNS